MSFRPRSLALMGVLALGALTPALPAAAIPLVGIGASGGAYGGMMMGAKSGLSYELDGNAEVLGFDGAATLVGQAGGGTILEVGLRKELSFLPMISVKPMVGYQTQNFFGTGSMDNAPLARLDVGFSPILSPVWFDGNVGVSYPLAYGQPLSEYMVGGYFALLPIASVGVRYRGWMELSGGNAFNALEAGLRVSI